MSNEPRWRSGRWFPTRRTRSASFGLLIVLLIVVVAILAAILDRARPSPGADPSGAQPDVQWVHVAPDHGSVTRWMARREAS